MEFCPSNLFQQVLEAKHRAMIRGSYVYQPPAQTLDWLGQIFLGLEHMHNRLEILFRDAWLQLACRDGQSENTPLALLQSIPHKFEMCVFVLDHGPSERIRAFFMIS